MNKIDKQLEKIKKEKILGLMTHVVVGYPTLKQTEDIIKTMDNAGVDFIELQIPFSDPLADGPTIMRACEKALENGTKVKDAFELAEKLTSQISAPLLFMAYFNTVFKYGVKKFCQDAQKAGIAGLIVPDIPLEEDLTEGFNKYCKEFNLKNIKVVSPASTKERLLKNAQVCSGFIYCTARQGTTGTSNTLDPKIASYLKEVRKNIPIPLAVGFGISNRERLKQITPHSDIAVIGSAIIELINSSKREEILKNITQFIRELKK